MYETEANLGREIVDQVPMEVIRRFCELSREITSRTILPWSEHCTECVWPTCYTSCELYSPREDGRCRRFADGMVRVDCAEAVNSYLLKIRFKRWGKLWAPGNIRLRPMDDAFKAETWDYRIGVALHQLPLPRAIKNFAREKRYVLKKRTAYQDKPACDRPTSFLLEMYNPELISRSFTLCVRSVDPSVKVQFQYLIDLEPGFKRVRVPYEEIVRFIDLDSRFNVELTPNEEHGETTIYFGLMDFVREVQEGRASSSSSNPEQRKQGNIKCVVWDLDNTMWNGILVEDGPDKITLKPHIAKILQTLDERGILHSVASKNNRDEVLAVLKKFAIDEYFLCPQISWGTKSEALKRVAEALNIGIDTLLFVDDSEFELSEVSAVHSGVRTLNAARYLELPEMDICQVRVTAESRERRKLYQMESYRQDMAVGFGNDYMAFLRYCEIRVFIHHLDEDNLDRVHELTQRTNQMNFSGNRYERDVLRQILHSEYLDTHVIEVEDRFGSYGIVGFAVVDRRVPIMTDLMFSCRVQSKRVEHAFLTYILRKYIAETGQDFFANYRPTSRNAPSGRVFTDFGMRELERNSGVSRLLFPSSQAIPDDEIIKVLFPSTIPETKYEHS